MSYLALGSSAIRATSHLFAHAKSAIRWLQWLLRNLSILSKQLTTILDRRAGQTYNSDTQLFLDHF
jgi:hypothetical protein